MVDRYGSVVEYATQNWFIVIAGTCETELQKVKVKIKLSLVLN
jgi:hypothetical protein